MENKNIFTTLAIIVLIFVGGNLHAQKCTAPEFTFGASLNAIFATNDGYGRVQEVNSYGMRGGRGFEIYGKMGLGDKKRHRITLDLGYSKMINYDENTNFAAMIFSSNPDDQLHTNFNLLSAALGYEYLFGAPCRNKQYVGASFSFNNISTSSDLLLVTGKLKPAFRVGMQLKAGLEFVLGKGGNYGINVGFKYNLVNLFNQSNQEALPGTTEFDLNDGQNAGGRGFIRYIGVATLSLGFNLYTGVKERR
jgi:hypothetical protein